MNHGKQAPLKRIKAGDGLIYYSPREAYPDGAPLQAFTALAFIKDKTHWGAAFRFGQVGIGEADFRCIAQAMQCNV